MSRPLGNNSNPFSSRVLDGLDDEEIVDLLLGTKEKDDFDGGREDYENTLLRNLFHQRQAEIRRWSEEYAFHEGSSNLRIDEDGRLVRSISPPAAEQPVPNNVVGANPIAAQPELENPEDELLQQQVRETKATIAQAVRELKEDDDFVIVALDPKGQPMRSGFFATEIDNAFRRNHNHHDRLMGPTIRRLVITFAIGIVAISCALIPVLTFQSMRFFDGNSQRPYSPSFDPLLFDVLEIKKWTDHAQECTHGLYNRTAPEYELKDWFWNAIGRSPKKDCSAGVLHVPSQRVLNLDAFHSLVTDRKTSSQLKDYAFGVNISWSMPCLGHEQPKKNQCLEADFEKPIDSHPEPTLNECFRGVHDNLIDDKEIEAAVSMADELIEKGGDHFDVYYDVSYLDRMLPSIVKKTKGLLESTYLKKEGERKDSISNTNAVAFRVLTTGPMDGHDVKLKQNEDGMTMYLTQASALNETNYLHWVLQSRLHNDRAHRQSYYRLWPYRLEPKRETCDLMYDLEADSRFCIQTSVFLTSGAGEDYQGGTSLFVDSHPSNFANPSRRIARGVSIDGSKGRIVVSTGGFENLRCRFPTRTGFRTVLQIWWNCERS